MNAISSKFTIMKISKIQLENLLLLPKANSITLMYIAAIKKLKQKVLIISQLMNTSDYNNTLPIELYIFLTQPKDKKKLIEPTTYKKQLTMPLLNQIKLQKDQINKRFQMLFLNLLLMVLNKENAHILMTHYYHWFKQKLELQLKKCLNYLKQSKLKSLL